MEKDQFEPLGEQAEWKIVYAKLRTLGVDQVISYETLTDLLGRRFEDDRNPIYRATRELEETDHKTVENVRGRGYRVIHPSEHEKLAKGHVRKSHRQLKKAGGKVASADRSALTPEERRRLDALEANIKATHGAVLALNRKVSDHDEALEKIRADAKKDRRSTREDVAEVSEKVDRLAALLERHGITQPAPQAESQK